MGCDIHVHTEIYEDNKWHHIDKLGCNMERQPWHLHEIIMENYTIAPYYVIDEVYEDRNYQVFSILAGVRGCIEPIAHPKGLPDDLSDTVQEIADFHCEHTPSWLTLKELLDYNYWGLPSEEKEWVSHFFSRDDSKSAINKLKKLARAYRVRSQDLRIVFWFDS